MFLLLTSLATKRCHSRSLKCRPSPPPNPCRISFPRIPHGLGEWRLLTFKSTTARNKSALTCYSFFDSRRGSTPVSTVLRKSVRYFIKKISFLENGLDNFSPSNFQALEIIIIFRRFVRLHPRRMELANTLSKLYDSETQVWGL